MDVIAGPVDEQFLVDKENQSTKSTGERLVFFMITREPRTVWFADTRSDLVLFHRFLEHANDYLTVTDA